MGTHKHSKVARVYFDHIRVSRTVGSTGANIDADEAEIAVLEGPSADPDAKEFLQGKVGASGSTLNGLADVANAGWDEEEFGDINDGVHYVDRMYQGNAKGTSMVLATKEFSTGDSRAWDVGAIFGLNWNGRPTGKFYLGKVLTDAEETISGTGLLTGINFGATTTAQQLMITIRCVAVNGTGSFTLQAHESSDDASGDPYAQITGWTIEEAVGNVSAGTDEVTFTGVGAIRMRLPSTATEDWINLMVSAFTGFTDATIIASIGIAAT